MCTLCTCVSWVLGVHSDPPYVSWASRSWPCAMVAPALGSQPRVKHNCTTEESNVRRIVCSSLTVCSCAIAHYCSPGFRCSSLLAKCSSQNSSQALWQSFVFRLTNWGRGQRQYGMWGRRGLRQEDDMKVGGGGALRGRGCKWRERWEGWKIK